MTQTAMTDVTLRTAREPDLPVMRALFREAIEAVGPERYSDAQIAAWAATADNARRFRRLTLGAYALIAEDATGPVGFASLGEGGYIIMIYVRPASMRRGVGRRLLAALIEQARARGDTELYTEASLFSVPLFQRAGFAVESVETIVRRGATFERFIMARPLGPEG